MDFNRLEAFLNVAKYKNFSKAGAESSTSQPTISSYIAKLEKELKVQLFDRNSREVVLTSAGESFLNFARDMVEARDKAVADISSFNDNVAGKLHIGAGITPCNIVLPGLLADFNSLYPEVVFSISEQNTEKILEKISKFEEEIGIVGTTVNDEKINCHKLILDELLVISPVSYNFPKEVSMNILVENNFIMREKNSDTRKAFEDILSDNNIELGRLNISCEVNSIDTLMQFVKEGIGISVVSSEVCKDYASMGLIRISRIQNVEMKRCFYLAVSTKRTLTPAAKAFFDFCKDRYKFN
ncbi:MAG: selenium metabolism-associated LysR family transcriptional regulator [Solirubrobacterales bacterium]